MLSFLGFWLADTLVGTLPSRTVAALALGLARLWFAVRPAARRTLERNLERLAPRLSAGERSARARRAFEHFALSVVDFLRLGRADRAALAGTVEIRGAQHLDAALAAGRGVIVLSAHVGSWEWGAAWLAARGPRLHVVARRHRSRLVERAFARTRRRQGLHVLPERRSWLHAAAALRRGEWVALMADRGADADAHRRGPAVCAWAAALARRTGAWVLPGVMLRLPSGELAACFEAPLTPERLAAGRHREALSRLLSRAPDQWFGFEPLPEELAG